MTAEELVLLNTELAAVGAVCLEEPRGEGVVYWLASTTKQESIAEADIAAFALRYGVVVA